nr:immunoglobulin heavy chain junction region [Macaca mulatta]
CVRDVYGSGYDHW